jgi:hypothetical protein
MNLIAYKYVNICTLRVDVDFCRLSFMVVAVYDVACGKHRLV